MGNRSHLQKQTSSQSTFTTVTNPFQPRPFAPPTEILPQQQETPDLQKEQEKPQSFGYNLAKISITNRNGVGQLPIQTKLTIGQPGDKYEQEADSVAAQVVNQINTPVAQQSVQGQTIQRQDTPDEEELMMKPMVQRQEAIGGGTATPDLEASINQARSGGQPLGEPIRRQMESAFGANFSSVKIHSDIRSDLLNRSIQARAFTTGNDIFFRQGAYNPGSRGGQELLAHELTHVVQQSPLRQGKEEETSLKNEITIGDNGTSKEIQRYLKIEGEEKKESDVNTLVDEVIKWANIQQGEWKSQAETNQENMKNILNKWLSSKVSSLPLSNIKWGKNKNKCEAQWKDFPSFSQFAMHLIEESNLLLLTTKNNEISIAKEIVQDKKVAKDINDLRLKVGEMVREKTNPFVRKLALFLGPIRPNLQGSYNWAGSYPKNLPSLNLIYSKKDYNLFQNIAIMHDVMELLSSKNAGRVVPTFFKNIVPEPFTSVESKSTLYNKDTKQIEYKVTERKGKGYDRGKLNIGTRDETSLDTQTARMLVLPIAAGRSHTTARMMELAELANATTEQKTSLALGLFAYWNSGMFGSYPVGLTPFHTYHEVMDVAKSYGVPYEPIVYSTNLQSITAKAKL